MYADTAFLFLGTVTSRREKAASLNWPICDASADSRSRVRRAAYLAGSPAVPRHHESKRAQPVSLAKPLFPLDRFGGAVGNRTPDLDIANVALYQLSYDPNPEPFGDGLYVVAGPPLSSHACGRKADMRRAYGGRPRRAARRSPALACRRIRR